MDIIHRVSHREQTKVHVPLDSEEKGHCSLAEVAVGAGCRSWYARASRCRVLSDVCDTALLNQIGAPFDSGQGRL